MRISYELSLGGYVYAAFPGYWRVPRHPCIVFTVNPVLSPVIGSTTDDGGTVKSRQVIGNNVQYCNLSNLYYFSIRSDPFRSDVTLILIVLHTVI